MTSATRALPAADESRFEIAAMRPRSLRTIDQ